MEVFLHVAPPLASVAVLLSPFPTVRNIAATQSTGDLPALTYVSLGRGARAADARCARSRSP